MDTQPASIALFLPNLAGGGAERVLVTLANAFAKRHYVVTLILANTDEMHYAKELDAGVRLKVFNRSRVIKTLPALVSYLRKHRPTALLTTLNHVSFTAALAVLIANTGTLLVAREDLAPDPRPAFLKHPGLHVYHRLIQFAYNRAQAIVSLSTDMADRLKACYTLHTPIYTIYNPIPLTRICQLANSDLMPGPPWPLSDPMILAVGRLEPQKDLPTLLHAFAGLPAGRTARLVVLGEGSERAALEQLALDLGIAEQLWLPGYVANPYPFMKQAAVFVLCSRREGLPNSLIQALACGTPCIATDCLTGPREILDNGARGTLIKVGDRAALTKALDAALRSNLPLDQRPSSQPAEFMQQYDTETIATLYLQVLLGER